MAVINRKIYALYNDDTFIDIGTLQQLAIRLNVGIRTIQSYKAKPYRYKYVFVYLGKEGDLINE